MGTQVQIEIRGRKFNIRTSDDGSLLRRLATELDLRLEEQANRSKHFDDYSVSVITALNILSELEEVRSRQIEQIEIIDRELTSISASVEALLPDEDDATEST